MAMDDKAIIKLFFDRDEEAIAATAEKYGNYCQAIANNILHNSEDTAEIVNDAYLRTWNAIPSHKTNFVKKAAIAACFCIAIGGSMLFISNTKNHVEEVSSAAVENIETENTELTTTRAEYNIIWGKETGSQESSLTTRNGKTLSDYLNESLDNADEGDAFAVLAIPNLKNDFIYEGKTLAQYSEAMEAEVYLHGVLSQLIEEGDALKYGPSLCETGDANGEIWGKAFYEERLAYYGEELLNKYIVDGEFLKDKAIDDYNKTEELNSKKTYETAIEAFLESKLDELDFGILPAKMCLGRRGIIIHLTKVQFDELPEETYIGWQFDLANRTDANA